MVVSDFAGLRPGTVVDIFTQLIESARIINPAGRQCRRPRLLILPTAAVAHHHEHRHQHDRQNEQTTHAHGASTATDHDHQQNHHGADENQDPHPHGRPRLWRAHQFSQLGQCQTALAKLGRTRLFLVESLLGHRDQFPPLCSRCPGMLITVSRSTRAACSERSGPAGSHRITVHGARVGVVSFNPRAC